MMQLPGFGAERPIDVPVLIGADGPKGLAVAAELGDGVFSAAVPQPDAVGVVDWRAHGYQIPAKIAGFEALGVTELVYQPAGSDIERELRAFASATGLTGLTGFTGLTG
jgi:hypothetical protein